MSKAIRVIIDDKELKEKQEGNPGPGEFVVRNNRIIYGDPGRPERPVRDGRESDK